MPDETTALADFALLVAFDYDFAADSSAKVQTRRTCGYPTSDISLKEVRVSVSSGIASDGIVDEPLEQNATLSPVRYVRGAPEQLVNLAAAASLADALRADTPAPLAFVLQLQFTGEPEAAVFEFLVSVELADGRGFVSEPVTASLVPDRDASL